MADRIDGTGGSGNEQNVDRAGTGKTWDNEDSWWRSNFADRPYAQSGLGYDYYQPAYRYGTEAANHHMGRDWKEVESDLRTGWDKYTHEGSAKSTWEDMKDAVHDAWQRVTGRHGVDADQMSKGSYNPGGSSARDSR